MSPFPLLSLCFQPPFSKTKDTAIGGNFPTFFSLKVKEKIYRAIEEGPTPFQSGMLNDLRYLKWYHLENIL